MVNMGPNICNNKKCCPLNHFMLETKYLQGVSPLTYWNGGFAKYKRYLPQYLPLFEAIKNYTTTWTEFAQCHTTQKEVYILNIKEAIYITIAILF